MTALPLLRTRTEPTWQHAQPEDYRAFVHSYTDKPFARWELVRHYRRFVARYPDLRTWFAAPLPVRVGRLLGETTPGSDLVSYRARPYLMYLAFRGQIRFDWPWLLAIGKIRFNDVDLIGLNREIEELVQTATALGYRATDVRYELRWAVSRLLLHRGSPLVHDLTDADLAAAVDAIYAFRDRPDVATFVESAKEYRRRIQHQYGWCLHVLHVVLYHRGQVATPPRRVARPRPPRPSLNPPLEAVVQRYVAACRSTREPVTIKGLAVTLGHFIAWLTETHREITAWPMVRREHVLAYADVNTGEEVHHQPG